MPGRVASPARRKRPLARVHTVRDAEALKALSHPARVALLERLREPASAAEAARQLGEPRQRVNYHLKTLEEAGLVEKVGTRRRGNFVESLYRAAARAFVVAPEIAWGDPRRMRALRRDRSLETLVETGSQLQRDAVALLDRAAFDDEPIASATVSAEMRFAGPDDRAAFMRAYLASTRALIDKYDNADGERYRVVLAVHPKIEETEA
jgi:DNA-binding transcriptional ArsR family regulator